MSKYKVGDKVRIKKDLKVEQEYNECGFAPEMAQYCGKILTIKNAQTYACGDRYDLEGISHYRWSNDMLETYIVNSLGDLQFGDILTLRNGERYVYTDKTIYGERNHYHCNRDIVTMSFKENLTRDSSLHEYDIIKVEREGQVVYEREDVREMTVEEISKALGYEVKVVK